MDRPTLLIVGRALDWIADQLRRNFALIERPAAVTLTAGEAKAISVLACFGGSGGVDGALMDRLPGLRGIVNFGVGYDRIDVAAAAARGLPVAYLPGTTAGCVADHAMALLLALARRVVAGHAFISRGAWMETRFPLTHRISGRRMGIYGLGAIGMAVARRAQGFDMEIGYRNRSPRADAPYRHFASLAELAAWSEILVVACPANAETAGTVNAEVLAALGRDGLLVNVGRGQIVDEAALVAALDAGAIGGAGLDVFAVEPCTPKALIGRDNVVLTPHVAGGTQETWRDTVNKLEANLLAVARTGAVLDPVPGTRADGKPARP